MADQIYQTFLKRQHEAALAFAAESDRVSITVGPGNPPCVYLVRFDSRCLIQDSQGQIRTHEGFGVRVVFPLEYIRRAEPFRVVNFLYPRNVFHPNILARMFAICIGRLEPGTELVPLIDQCHAIGTWQKLTMSEHDALNRDACLWARRNPHRYPVDDRPLKRASAGFEIAVNGAVASA